MMSNNISIKESSTELIPILTAGTNGSNYFDRIYDTLEIAKNQGIHQYLTGQILIEKLPDVIAQKPIKFNFIKMALDKQTHEDAEKERVILRHRATSDPLYPYQLLIQGNPNQPGNIVTPHSKAEGRLWRNGVNIPTAIAQKIILNAGFQLTTGPTVDHNENRRCAMAAIPARYISEFHRPNDNHVVQACRSVQLLDMDDVEELIDIEIANLTDIARVNPQDTEEQLLTKLRSTDVITQFDTAQSRYNQRLDNILHKNAKVKDFLEKVVPISKSIASNEMEALNWKGVLDTIENHFINNVQFSSTSASTQLDFTSDMSVLAFKFSLQRHLARIQVIDQLKDAKAKLHQRLSFAEALEDVLALTDAQWTVKFFNQQTNESHPRKMTLDHTVVEIIISAVSNNPTMQAVIHHKLTDMATATSNDLFAVMLSKERLINQTSGVQVNNVNIQAQPTIPKRAKFCLYHSYNGNTSTHNTEDCNHVKRDLTYKSSTSKFHKLKSTDEYYTAPSAAQRLQYRENNRQRTLKQAEKTERKHTGKRTSEDDAATIKRLKAELQLLQNKIDSEVNQVAVGTTNDASRMEAHMEVLADAMLGLKSDFKKLSGDEEP